MSDINDIFAKIGLSEDEARELVLHFASDILEKYSVNVNVSTCKEYEYESTYATVRVDVSIDTNGATIEGSGSDSLNIS